MDKKTMALRVEAEMLPFHVLATPRDGYLRVWNCYTGSIMGAFNARLNLVAKQNGMTVKRERTYGDGRIAAADWEDRMTPGRIDRVEGGYLVSHPDLLEPQVVEDIEAARSIVNALNGGAA